uniref:Protein-export membrane protein SecG n=1 Tax=Avrainvillea sp. HV04061 TaxID=2364086 RepID=A0A3B8CLJ9_9CHLO|nr:hypothetical protein Ycf47 [Avrainvillea sp. HV04061]
MFHLHIIFNFIVLLVIVPQTSKENSLIITFNNSGLFKNYAEAKKNLLISTWITIFLFFIFKLFF